MTKFTQVFGIDVRQANLDFVDIDLDSDTPLYIDPYAIQIRKDEWSDRCGDHIRSYFNQLLDVLRSQDMARAEHLLNHLHEPNETRLGESSGLPSGRGVGDHKASLFADALVKSKAFKTGLLTDISEAELFIYGVGRDTISDLTTNIIRGPLAEYTKDQCNLLGVPTQPVTNIGPVWSVEEGDWQSSSLHLPVHQGNPVLLVPKYSVRYQLSINSQEFWNHHMIEFSRREYLNAGGSLVRTFKRSKQPYVRKKDVKHLHPLIKDDLAEFVRRHPEVLDLYKKIKGASGPIENRDMDNNFDDSTFAAALKTELSRIPEGTEHASKYHSMMLGICTFLFYPGLIYPVKEQEIHQGRKRVDIKFTNAAQSGFFDRILKAPQTRSLSVMIECKNYQKEVGNPEMDQSTGRFGYQRGFFGILLCRRIDDRQRMVARCRDAASDGRGFIFVLDDSDITHMLELVERGVRPNIDQFLQRKFDEISH